MMLSEYDTDTEPVTFICFTRYPPSLLHLFQGNFPPLKQINSPDLGNSFVVFPEQEEGTGTNCDNCRLSIIHEELE